MKRRSESKGYVTELKFNEENGKFETTTVAHPFLDYAANLNRNAVDGWSTNADGKNVSGSAGGVLSVTAKQPHERRLHDQRRASPSKSKKS
jgi:hypothetical protein